VNDWHALPATAPTLVLKPPELSPPPGPPSEVEKATGAAPVLRFGPPDDETTGGVVAV
jgi:hypothetical protein